MYGDGPIDWFFYLQALIKDDKRKGRKRRGDTELSPPKGNSKHEGLPLDPEGDGNHPNPGGKGKVKGSRRASSRVPKNNGT